MNGDWLWDETGEPDPEVGRLQGLLAPYAYRPPAGGELSRLERTAHRPGPRRALGARPVWAPLAAAAVILLTLVAVLQVPGPRPALAVTRYDAGSWSGQTVWGEGEKLLTGPDQKARVALGGLGEVEVEPGTELRLVANSPREERLALDHGSIQASVNAPPRLFLVDLPRAARAVDLGCAYRLSSDAEGNGNLVVTRGFVSLEAPSGPGLPPDVLVPAGYTAKIEQGIPGTPFAADAPQPFRPETARPQDALTLWDLAWRSGGDHALIDRLAQLVPPPAPRDKLYALDRETMLAWRSRMVSGVTGGKGKKTKGG